MKSSMKHFLSISVAAVLAAATSGSLRAQDPAKEIQELARRVAEQLEEIDRLLLESSQKNQPRSTPSEKLKQASATSEAATSGIDELIDKLNEMKNQGGGGGGQSQDESNQDQQPQDGQQQGQQSGQSGQQGPRRENQTPDFVQQPKQGGQQEGQQPGQEGQQPGGQQPGGQEPGGQQPGSGNPEGGQHSNDPGKNTTGNRQLEPELGPGQQRNGDESWGDLPDYVNFLKNRGSPPKVPEKFRKYWEAYLRNKRGSGN